MDPSAAAADALVEQFERGHLSRRQLVSRLLALGAAAAVPAVARADDSVATTTAASPTFSATGLDHLALSVTDVRRSAAFYQRHLGLRLARDGGDATAFLDCRSSTGDGRRPDFLALFRGEKPGLHHFSFSVPDYSADDAMKRLEGAGLAPRRQGNRVYFPDPDGLTVQVHE